MREKQGPGLFVEGQLVCDVATQIDSQRKDLQRIMRTSETRGEKNKKERRRCESGAVSWRQQTISSVLTIPVQDSVCHAD
jgi:hypothetical protein